MMASISVEHLASIGNFMRYAEMQLDITALEVGRDCIC